MRASPALLLLATSLLGAQQPRTRIERPNFDTTCAACTDFYRFANGGWVARATIPSTQPMWGTWNELSERVDSTLRAVVMDASRDRAAARGSPTQLIGAYYRSCMDTVGAETRGLRPVEPLLSQVDAIGSAADVGRAISALQADGLGAVFGFGGSQDPKDATHVIAMAFQSGLGLPTRDYYTRDDARTRELRDAYVGYLTALFTLAGESADAAHADAARDMTVEERLAAVSLSPVQLRDPDLTYHTMPLAELQALTPHFDWSHYLSAIAAPRVPVVDVTAPEFFRGMDTLLVTLPPADWRAYLRATVLRSFASSLDSAFANEDFRYRRRLTGVPAQPTRDRRCLAATNGPLGELVGEEYVTRAFTPAAKQRALDMVSDLRAVLHDRIAALEWMSDSTKRAALAKLDSLRLRIGYPETWRDYSSLALGDTSFVANMLAARRWAQRENLARIGGPVDREHWSIPPQTVDAYALSGEIVFPAGILQPPFFDPNADDAVNYGAIGAVIGHEMTHHFDDHGRRYDAAGNLRDWWTAEDAAKYEARARLVVEQFDAYTVVDSSTHVNGKLTLGENIADLGGLKVAYLALEKALARKGRPAAIDGFSPEQRFFLAYAQVWRSVARPEYARMRVNTDNHAPWMWRVNGPLSNMPEFAAAWGCKEGDPMVRPAGLRAAIW